jgi:hypothetical protein
MGSRTERKIKKREGKTDSGNPQMTAPSSDLEKVIYDFEDDFTTIDAAPARSENRPNRLLRSPRRCALPV